MGSTTVFEHRQAPFGSRLHDLWASVVLAETCRNVCTFKLGAVLWGAS